MSQLGYQLIDSGEFLKLEQIGEWSVIRPCLGAPWQKCGDSQLWQSWQAFFKRNSSGGGIWSFKSKPLDPIFIQYANVYFKIKLTGFGHMGLFPEQIENWNWLEELISKNKRVKVLNLFGYTGGSSMVCAKAGASVCHVDAAKGVVDWARENADKNQLVESIRWIVDDVQKFVKKEIKRNQLYEGIILDPPTFGRGPLKELWDIDQHIMPLLCDIKKLINPKQHFILLSAHSPGYTPVVLHNILKNVFPHETVAHGEMLVCEKISQRYLPAGAFARFSTF